MARLRRNCIVQLTALLALAWAAPAHTQDAAEAGPAGLHNRPTLVLDPGMHTAAMTHADVDAEGRYAVTGALDKTIRVWSVEDGQLLRTIRLPAGPGSLGQVRAVAISADGEVIAAGGWTTGRTKPEKIYLFDRATGAMTGRIEGLPETLTHLTFSSDGRYLAAALAGANGLRVYDRRAGWAEVAHDTDYADASYGADFSPDGRLATTSWDGHVRLYDGSFNRVEKVQTPGGRQPYRIAFSPDGTKLAVGHGDSTAVQILDGSTLASLASPNTYRIDNGSLISVAWSAEGGTLFAGGQYDRGDGISPVVAWPDAGTGARRELRASGSTIVSLVPLPHGGLLVAAADPYVAVLGPDGDERWAQKPKQADFRNQNTTLSVSNDGHTVDFGYEPLGKAPARFDVAARSLRNDPAVDDKTAQPDRLVVLAQLLTNHPTLNGALLSLDRYEMPLSLAIDPKGARFVLGTAWALRAYDVQGGLLWRQASGHVWAVNITGDGRLVVAAYSDGTIRWHLMDDGRSSSPSSRLATGRTGSPGRPMASTPRRPARTACCAGTSTMAGTRRARPSRCRTSRSCAAPRSCRSCCRRWTSCRRSALPG